MRTITPAVCTRPYFCASVLRQLRCVREKYGAGNEAKMGGTLGIPLTQLKFFPLPQLKFFPSPSLSSSFQNQTNFYFCTTHKHTKAYQ